MERCAIDALTLWIHTTFGSEVGAWLLAFAFTQIVEVPLYVVWMTAFCGISVLPAFGFAFLLSAATHPVVWFGMPPLIYTNVCPAMGWPLSSNACYGSMLVIVETFAVLVEAWMLNRYGIQFALRVAFVANMVSLSLGLLSRHFFGIP